MRYLFFTLACIALPFVAGRVDAQTLYWFSNLQNCYMAADASEDFNREDCDTAWARAAASNQFMARVEICNPQASPLGCGTPAPGAPRHILDEIVTEEILKRVGAGETAPLPDDTDPSTPE